MEVIRYVLRPLRVQDMVAQMLDKGKCLMRVDGPYGVPGGPGWHKYDALVIIAGGIGELSSAFNSYTRIHIYTVYLTIFSMGCYVDRVGRMEWDGIGFEAS